MRSAIGNASLLSIVVFIVSAVIVLFVSVLAYSKAIRAKNNVIEILEQYELYTPNGSIASKSDDLRVNASVAEMIDQNLAQMGYNISYKNDCNAYIKKTDGIVKEYTGSDFDICIIYYGSSNSFGSHYYEVITFTNFHVPIIENLLRFPIKGETKYMGKNYNY